MPSPDSRPVTTRCCSSNHGPVVSGASLDAAADAIEELEATAKLWLLVRHEAVRPLDAAALADLARRFPR